MNITKENLVKLLEACTYEQQLKKAVLQDALEAIEAGGGSYLYAVVEKGCVSGSVPSLVYYHEAANFYDKHYDEIEDLRIEVEANMGEPLRIEGDIKTFFAWFAYEETSEAVIYELEAM